MWQAASDAIKRRAFQPPQPPSYDERGVLVEPALLGASAVADGGALLDGELRVIEPAQGAPADDPRRIYVALVRAEGTAAEARARPTILYSHGNASDLGEMLHAARTLARRSGHSGLWCNVALYDYSGYGLSQLDAQQQRDDGAAAADDDDDGDGSEGSLGLAVLQYGTGDGERAWEAQRRRRRRAYVGEAALLVDVERCKREAFAVYRHLVDDERVPPASIVLWGTSIGSGPACALAAHLSDSGFAGAAAPPPFGCLVLQTPIFSVYSVGAPLLHALVPGDFFCNGEELAHVTRPVAIFHGTSDATVPYSHAVRLYAVLTDSDVSVLPDAAARCHLWGVKGADHNNITTQRFWRDLAPVLRAFIAENTDTALFTPAKADAHHADDGAAADEKPPPATHHHRRSSPAATKAPPPVAHAEGATAMQMAAAAALLRRSKQFAHY